MCITRSSSGKGPVAKRDYNSAVTMKGWLYKQVNPGVLLHTVHICTRVHVFVFITLLLLNWQSIAIVVSVCLSVCLSSCISHNHMSKFSVMSRDVARSSSDESAICYVLPVWWMTSHCDILEPQNYVSFHSLGGSIAEEVCRLRLHLVFCRIWLFSCKLM